MIAIHSKSVLAPFLLWKSAFHNPVNSLLIKSSPTLHYFFLFIVLFYSKMCGYMWHFMLMNAMNSGRDSRTNRDRGGVGGAVTGEKYKIWQKETKKVES